MGINSLLQTLRGITNTVPISKYQGQTVVVDGYAWLYKGAYSCPQELGRGEPTDKQRQENLQLAREAEQKGNVRVAYNYYQRAITVSVEMVQNTTQALAQQGVDFIIAPYEADAQMAYLALNNFVDAVVTEDSDLLAYGCPCVLFKYDAQKQYAEEIRLENLGLNRKFRFDGFDAQMFLEYCILCGCDFIEKPNKFGPVKALEFMKKHRNFFQACKAMRREYQVSDDHEVIMQKVVWVFNHQVVYCPHEKRQRHLKPLPSTGLKSKFHEVQSKLSENDHDIDLTFLGEIESQQTAVKFSTGKISPANIQMHKQASDPLYYPITTSQQEKSKQGNGFIAKAYQNQTPAQTKLQHHKILQSKTKSPNKQRGTPFQAQDQKVMPSFEISGIHNKMQRNTSSGLYKRRTINGKLNQLECKQKLQYNSQSYNQGLGNSQIAKNFTGQKQNIMPLRESLQAKLKGQQYGRNSQGKEQELSENYQALYSSNDNLNNIIRQHQQIKQNLNQQIMEFQQSQRENGQTLECHDDDQGARYQQMQHIEQERLFQDKENFPSTNTQGYQEPFKNLNQFTDSNWKFLRKPVNEDQSNHLQDYNFQHTQQNHKNSQNKFNQQLHFIPNKSLDQFQYLNKLNRQQDQPIQKPQNILQDKTKGKSKNKISPTKQLDIQIPQSQQKDERNTQLNAIQNENLQVQSIQQFNKDDQASNIIYDSFRRQPNGNKQYQNNKKDYKRFNKRHNIVRKEKYSLRERDKISPNKQKLKIVSPNKEIRRSPRKNIQRNYNINDLSKNNTFIDRSRQFQGKLEQNTKRQPKQNCRQRIDLDPKKFQQFSFNNNYNQYLPDDNKKKEFQNVQLDSGIQRNLFNDEPQHECSQQRYEDLYQISNSQDFSRMQTPSQSPKKDVHEINEIPTSLKKATTKKSSQVYQHIDIVITQSQSQQQSQPQDLRQIKLQSQTQDGSQQQKYTSQQSQYSLRSQSQERPQSSEELQQQQYQNVQQPRQQSQFLSQSLDELHPQINEISASFVNHNLEKQKQQTTKFKSTQEQAKQNLVKRLQCILPKNPKAKENQKSQFELSSIHLGSKFDNNLRNQYDQEPQNQQYSPTLNIPKLTDKDHQIKRCQNNKVNSSKLQKSQLSLSLSRSQSDQIHNILNYDNSLSIQELKMDRQRQAKYYESLSNSFRVDFRNENSGKSVFNLESSEEEFKLTRSQSLQDNVFYPINLQSSDSTQLKISRHKSNKLNTSVKMNSNWRNNNSQQFVNNKHLCRNASNLDQPVHNESITYRQQACKMAQDSFTANRNFDVANQNSIDHQVTNSYRQIKSNNMHQNQFPSQQHKEINNWVNSDKEPFNRNGPDNQQLNSDNKQQHNNMYYKDTDVNQIVSLHSKSISADDLSQGNSHSQHQYKLQNLAGTCQNNNVPQRQNVNLDKLRQNQQQLQTVQSRMIQLDQQNNQKVDFKVNLNEDAQPSNLFNSFNNQQYSNNSLKRDSLQSDSLQSSQLDTKMKNKDTQKRKVQQNPSPQCGHTEFQQKVIHDSFENVSDQSPKLQPRAFCQPNGQILSEQAIQSQNLDTQQTNFIQKQIQDHSGYNQRQVPLYEQLQAQQLKDRNQAILCTSNFSGDGQNLNQIKKFANGTVSACMQDIKRQQQLNNQVDKKTNKDHLNDLLYAQQDTLGNKQLDNGFSHHVTKRKLLESNYMGNFQDTNKQFMSIDRQQSKELQQQISNAKKQKQSSYGQIVARESLEFQTPQKRQNLNGKELPQINDNSDNDVEIIQSQNSPQGKMQIIKQRNTMEVQKRGRDSARQSGEKKIDDFFCKKIAVDQNKYNLLNRQEHKSDDLNTRKTNNDSNQKKAKIKQVPKSKRA